MKRQSFYAGRRPVPSHTVPRWKDLRDWLALVEGHGALHRIAAEVDPHQELSALTFMATRRKDSPASLFERFADNPLNARVLSNMLGASKERYALAVGLDPGLSTLELVHATRALMKQRIAPVFVPANHAPVNEVVLRGEEIDLTRLPAPTFWPADGGRFIGTGGITIDEQLKRPAQRRLLSPAAPFARRRIGLNFVPGRHGQTDCEAAWAEGEAGRRLRCRLRR